VSSAVLEVGYLVDLVGASLKPAPRKCANLTCGCVLSKSNHDSLCRTCAAKEEQPHLKGQTTDMRNRQRNAGDRADLHTGYMPASHIPQRLPLPSPRLGPQRGAAIQRESQRLRTRYDNGYDEDCYSYA
jgi:hypothetical protein